MKNKIQLTICTIILAASSQSIAQNIEPYKSREIKPDTAKQISAYKSKGIEVYKAKSITPEKSKEIEVYKAKSITPDKPKEIKVYKAEAINPARSNDQAKTQKGKSSSKENNAEANSAEFYFGPWHTRVPGAVWTSPGETAGYDKLHISAGAQSGDLIINANGTYKWNSYGGKKGKWIKGDSEYPVVLIDNAENKKWKVGFDPKHTGQRDIIIWDGNIWYDGRR